MAECPLPKPNTRVRFPSSAPKRTRTPKRVRVLFSDRILNQNPLRILLFCAKVLTNQKKCAIMKIRGNTGDGCYLPLTEITANFRGAGGYFFLLNDRMTKIVVINDNTTPENCISCSKVM